MTQVYNDREKGVDWGVLFAPVIKRIYAETEDMKRVLRNYYLLLTEFNDSEK